MPKIEETTTTQVTPAENTAAPRKERKKAARKEAKVEGNKKGAKASQNGSVEKKPRARKEGLREPQLRILKALAKAPGGLTRGDIAKKAGVDPAMGHYLGASDPENYASYSEKYGFSSLLSLKYVKAEQHDVDGRDTILHLITAAGRKALEKADK